MKRGVVLAITIINLVNRVFQIYYYILIIYALLSWLPDGRNSQFGRLISKLACPYLDIFDRFIPPVAGISFNVIIALFVLNFIQRGFIYFLVWIFNILG